MNVYFGSLTRHTVKSSNVKFLIETNYQIITKLPVSVDAPCSDDADNVYRTAAWPP